MSSKREADGEGITVSLNLLFCAETDRGGDVRQSQPPTLSLYQGDHGRGKM